MSQLIPGGKYARVSEWVNNALYARARARVCVCVRARAQSCAGGGRGVKLHTETNS